MSKRLIVALAVVWMIVLVASISSSMTLALCGLGGDESSRGRILVTDEEYEIIDRYGRVQEILELVETNYYKEVDEEAMLTGAIRGMLDSLEDPYTFYYTPEEMSASNEHQEGTYVGVGLQVLGSAEGELIVTRAFKGSSALEEGVRAGDRILMVDGQPVSAETTQAMNDAVAMIKGEAGTEVTLTLERGGTQMDVVLTRSKINMNRVEYEMLSDGVGYIMLYEFMGDDVDGFKEAVSALQVDGAKGLIVDVRSNPGGLLTDVIEICDMLLPDGLIVYTENRIGERESFYSDADSIDMPLVVLINEMSASASEILAGSVQDTGVGTIVGQTTFGKGIVQVVLPFESDGAGMQMTISTYYTPGGRCIHGTGIVPDVVVDNGDYDFTTAQPDPESDAQLKKAMEILEEEIAQ